MFGTERKLITTRTTPAPTANALYRLLLLELRLGHSTDTRGIEIGFLGLYAPEAAQLNVISVINFH